MGDSELALLAGHGVFVLGITVRAVHQRAVALEQRCKHAWHVRAAERSASRRCHSRGSTAWRRATATGSSGSGSRWPAPSCGPIRPCSTERLAVEEPIGTEVEDLTRVAHAHQLEHAVTTLGPHAVHRAEDGGEQGREQRAA